MSNTGNTASNNNNDVMNTSRPFILWLAVLYKH